MQGAIKLYYLQTVLYLQASKSVVHVCYISINLFTYFSCHVWKFFSFEIILYNSILPRTFHHSGSSLLFMIYTLNNIHEWKLCCHPVPWLLLLSNIAKDWVRNAYEMKNEIIWYHSLYPFDPKYFWASRRFLIHTLFGLKLCIFWVVMSPFCMRP